MGMTDRFRGRGRPAHAAPPEFTVVALDPGEWPGRVSAALVADPEGACRGVVFRYDLLDGSTPVYSLVQEVAAERPGAEAGAGAEGDAPPAVALLLAAAGVAEVPGVLAEESDIASVAGEPVMVTRVSYDNPELSYLSFAGPDGTSIGVAGWRNPVGGDLLAMLRPLPPELFGGKSPGAAGERPET